MWESLFREEGDCSKWKTNRRSYFAIFAKEFQSGKISRETGFSRPAVSKYVAEYREAQRKLKESKTTQENALLEDFVEAPRYKKPNRGKRKLTSEICLRIDALLQKNEENKAKGF